MVSFEASRRAGILSGLQFDVKALAAEIADLRALPELSGRTQISLAHRPGAESPYLDGAGSLWDEDRKMATARESEFTEFHRDWREGALFAAYETLQRQTGFRMGRFRVLILEPRRCYSIHQDTEIRFHIPIATNLQSFFLFGDCPPLHFAANGRAYWADTRHAHSAMNGHGRDERIHLVASVLETESRKFDDLILEKGSVK